MHIGTLSQCGVEVSCNKEERQLSTRIHEKMLENLSMVEMIPLASRKELLFFREVQKPSEPDKLMSNLNK